MTAQEIADFISEPATAILTTLGADGWPHSVGMWFAHANGELHMWAYAKSQKVANLRRDPRAAFIVERGDTYDSLRGVLVRGRVELIEDIEEIYDIGRRLYERYTEPITGIPAEAGPEADLRRQAAKRVGLVLPMERVASWDHRNIGRARSGSGGKP